jgi:predicted lipoprotein with Yx(FWY)xxD motif
MKRLLAPVLIIVAALTAGLALAARGSDDTDGPSPVAPEATDSETAASTSTVNLVEIEGLGAVLADAEGRVLYAADEETADPDVVCTDACEEFWEPLAAGSGAPTGAPGVNGLDVAERPDGTAQVTHQGRRLYTFSLDSPGEATGEGFSDTFGDQRFTWHAVVVDQTSAGGTATTETPDTAGDSYDRPGS